MEGRNFIGIEKNEDVALFKKEPIDYIEVAKQRLYAAWIGLDEPTREHLANINLIKDFADKYNEFALTPIRKLVNE